MRAVPVTFSLAGGDLGLAIFAGGSPASAAVTCGSSSYDAIEETVAAGSSYLQFDPLTDRYTYVWKTDRAWRGCRALVLTFRDGSSATAWFEFRK
ncbi:MAG TPA: PxKF domain-containing protein [Candidatus Limnocylindrales bacterium]|nr:PxKF domain-containing protein [Candidatus Limnocylindrales bacterium]